MCQKSDYWKSALVISGCWKIGLSKVDPRLHLRALPRVLLRFLPRVLLRFLPRNIRLPRRSVLLNHLSLLLLARNNFLLEKVVAVLDAAVLLIHPLEF